MAAICSVCDTNELQPPSMCGSPVMGGGCVKGLMGAQLCVCGGGVTATAVSKEMHGKDAMLVMTLPQHNAGFH